MKKLMSMIAAGITLSQMPAVLAAPVNVTGDVAAKYVRAADETATASGMVFTTRLMGETDFGGGWSGYTRIGAQHLTKAGFGDFNTESGGYDSNRKSVIAIDQFGLLYKADNLIYKLGRQDAAVGATALLYSRSDSNIGKKTFVDGLTVSGTTGVMDISALAAQEDNAGSLDNKIYAIRTGYSPRENLNWGLTLGRYQGSEIESTNHWAVDGTYTFGKSSVTAEFTKSSNNTNNKAYAATWNYGIDDKTASYITAFRVESNSAMGQQSDFDNNNQGLHYGITHNLNAADSLEIVYKDQKTISDRKKNHSLEITLSREF